MNVWKQRAIWVITVACLHLLMSVLLSFVLFNFGPTPGWQTVLVPILYPSTKSVWSENYMLMSLLCDAVVWAVLTRFIFESIKQYRNRLTQVPHMQLGRE